MSAYVAWIDSTSSMSMLGSRVRRPSNWFHKRRSTGFAGMFEILSRSLLNRCRRCRICAGRTRSRCSATSGK